MAYLCGYQADIYVTTVAAATFGNEPTTGDADGTIYTIVDVDMRFWDRDTPPIVEEKVGEDWVVVPAADYTVNHAGGQIVFKVALPAATIRVSGKYLGYSKLAQASEWTLDIARELKDANVFGDDWDVYQAVNGTGRLTATRFWLDGFFYDERLTLLGFKLMPNSSGTAAWYAFGRLTSQAANVTAKELQTEGLSFQVHGNIAYIEEPA